MITGRAKSFTLLCMIGAAMSLQSCTGILAGVYDEPTEDSKNTVAGQLYIDASQWEKWHYIDLKEVADSVALNPDYNANEHWMSYDIPMTEIDDPNTRTGIYTYWYDVFGAGISVNEFRSFYPTKAQEEPKKWTIAIHRNNVRTNGCAAATTNFKSFDELPEDRSFLSALRFEEDTWNEKDVWCEQSHMLLGLIGNQGITINNVLSSWLKVDIPPIPPAFTLNDAVFVVKLPDGTYGALQLVNYQSSTGTKCCLTINYRYPI